MSLRRLLPASFVLMLAGGALAVACSSSSSDSGPAPCNQDPWQCPAGQTCWVSNTSGAFACLNSAAGKNKGDSCKNVIGSPTCGDAMACFQQVGAADGTCVAYCDNTKAGHGCGAGETCQQVVLQTGGTFFVCIGGAPADGGVDTGTPADSATDSATDTATDSATDSGLPADSGTSVDAAGDADASADGG